MHNRVCAYNAVDNISIFGSNVYDGKSKQSIANIAALLPFASIMIMPVKMAVC
jgi:hypothetical protein